MDRNCQRENKPSDYIVFKLLKPLSKMIFYYKKLYGKFDNLGVKIA